MCGGYRGARLAELDVDAIVVDDLQDESSRTGARRPFPFLECIDPADYAFDYLAAARRKIVYRGVAGQTAEGLAQWLTRVEASEAAAVVVGAPSRTQAVPLRLSEAVGAV